MKRLNDNLLITALSGIIVLLVILISADLKGILSQTAYTVLFVIGLFPAVILLFILILRRETEKQSVIQAKRKANGFYPDKVKVARTLEGNICEGVTAMLLLGALIAGFINHVFAEGGDDSTQWMIVCFSAVSILLLVLVYHPTFFLFNRKSEITNAQQMVAAIRLNRVLAIELALASFLLALCFGHESAQNIIIVIMLTVSIIITLVFRFKYHNAE